MPAVPIRLLDTPGTIRAALHDLCAQAERVDAAIAFLGSDAPALLPMPGGEQSRLLCWLHSGATAPDAVEKLLRSTQVRHADSMHAKVVLGFRDAKPFRAVIGSANLSRSAMGIGDDDVAVRREVAVETSDAGVLSDTAAWFHRVWAAGHPVTADDLTRAWAAWRSRKVRGRAAGTTTPPDEPPAIPDGLTLSDRALFDAAVTWARDTDLRVAIDAVPVDAVARMKAGGVDETDVAHLVRLLGVWMDTRAIQRVRDEDLDRVRRTLAVIWDASRDPVDRVRYALHDGKLDGVGVSTVTTLMYWGEPARCPPLNRVTERHVGALGLNAAWPTDDVDRYAAWLGVAAQLQRAWALPTVGHVDRVLFAYDETAGKAWPRPFDNVEA